MGKNARMKQARLAEKLLQIRSTLGLSQSGMLKHLGFEEMIDYKRISEYELGKNEPPLAVLLEYARAAGVWVDVLIDNELDLPTRLPSVSKSEGIRRPSKAKAETGSKMSKQKGSKK